MSFKLQKTKQILICGNNVRANILVANLEEHGFDKITITNSKLQGYDGEANDTILFIAFQNALQHDDVAEDMYRQGFKDILFLPTRGCINDKKADLLRRMYNAMLYGNIDETIELPSYWEVKDKELRIRNGVIAEGQGMVTFWARIENIFVNDVCKKKNQHGLEYYGANLALVEHYRSLFELMEGREACRQYLSEYFEAQSYLDADKEIITEKIADRYQLFLLYKRELNKGMDFFISSASIVEGNVFGGLHIKEGLHRAVFLMTQNLAYLPVMMREKEFNNIYSENVLERVRDFFARENIKKTLTPIAHPAFYQFPAERENTEPSVLTAVNRFLGIKGIQGKRILDMSDYNSYFARNAGRRSCRNAAKEIESWEDNGIRLELACLYNDLLGINNVKVSGGSCPVLEKEYDMVFLMGKLDEMPDSIEWLRMLGKNVKETLFFETNADDVEVKKSKIISVTDFNKYVGIHRYYDGLKKREVGVFLKERPL